MEAIMQKVENAESVLRKWIELKLEESNLFLVEIKILPGNQLQLFIDGMDGVTIDRCAEISRYVKRMLDTEKIFGENYTLEVSSPGLENPFRVLKQYQKNVGREVEVLFHGGIKKFGILLKADENNILLEETINKEKIQNEIALNQIKFIKIKLKF